MRNIHKALLMLLGCLVMTYCQKNTTKDLTLDAVKNNENAASYPENKVDSLQAITQITRQKTREVLELSILYVNSNKSTEIDNAVLRQIQGYFYQPDSTTGQRLFRELDSLQVKNVQLHSFGVRQRVTGKDTLNFADFQVEYFGKGKRSLGTFPRSAQYVLMPSEVRFKKEFKFYFLDFYPKSALKDSVVAGVTR